METQTSSKLYLGLIVLLGFAAGYLYYSQIAQPAETAIEGPKVEKNDNLKLFQNLNIDLSILDNPVYKKLRVNGEMPVVAATAGKQDIFAP